MNIYAKLFTKIDTMMSKIDQKLATVEATMQGIVKQWTPGAGWILGFDGQTYYCDVSALDGLTVSSLMASQKIEFIAGENKRGDRIVVRVNRML
jgi:cold shock CspA family protein